MFLSPDSLKCNESASFRAFSHRHTLFTLVWISWWFCELVVFLCGLVAFQKNKTPNKLQENLIVAQQTTWEHSGNKSKYKKKLLLSGLVDNTTKWVPDLFYSQRLQFVYSYSLQHAAGTQVRLWVDHVNIKKTFSFRDKLLNCSSWCTWVQVWSHLHKQTRVGFKWTEQGRCENTFSLC